MKIKYKCIFQPNKIGEDNIKMDFQEIGFGAWTGLILIQDRDKCGSCCEHGNEPSASIKSVEWFQA